MTIEAIDPVSIINSSDLSLFGRPSYFPTFREADIQNVAFFSPDKSRHSVALICGDLADMQRIYDHYYLRPTSNIIWKRCQISEHLASRRPIEDLSVLG